MDAGDAAEDTAVDTAEGTAVSTASEALAAVVGSLDDLRDSLRRKDPDRPELVRGEDLIRVVDHLSEVTERLAVVIDALQGVALTADRADRVSAAVAKAVKPSLTKRQRRRLKKARRPELEG